MPAEDLINEWSEIIAQKGGFTRTNVIELMESYAKEKAIEFVGQFEELEFRRDGYWYYLPGREILEEIYSQYLKSK